MQISSKIIYALQFMLQLCEAEENQYTQVKDVAKREFISEKYLEHVVSQLKSSRLIEVKRGAKGGYRLLKKASEINLLDIYNSIEKTEFKPVGTKETESGNTLAKKTILGFLSEFEEIVATYLKNKSLADLHLEKSKLIEHFNFQI